MTPWTWLLSASVLAISGACYSQDTTAPTAATAGEWIDISAKVLQDLTAEGKKIGYPGKTAGIAVDRVTGDVFMVVPDQGIWKSSDRGESFARVDGGKIGGRCETGFALNFDPKGKRLACFMLDGPSGYTLDGGKTWEGMKGNGRGWDAGSVDWSAAKPACIFALRHECGGEVYTSDDMGKNWEIQGKAFASVGIFDAKTFVATQEKEKGIFRTVDGGKRGRRSPSFSPADATSAFSTASPTGPAPRGCWSARTRARPGPCRGQAVECSFGPYFGKDEKHIVVVGKKGFFETKDGGQQWQQVAPLPPRFSVAMPGWFLNFGWDPNADVFYASKMGEPAYRYQR